MIATPRRPRGRPRKENKPELVNVEITRAAHKIVTDEVNRINRQRKKGEARTNFYETHDMMIGA